MANTIALAQKFVPILDEIYKGASITSSLDSPAELVQATTNAKVVNIPKIDMNGMGDYIRNAGYVNGDVTLEWTPYQLQADRGRSFQVDAMDNEESINLAFGRLVGEFMRTKVVPEIDAYRFAKYASTPGILTTTAASLTNSTVVAAIDAAVLAMDDAEVPREGRRLFLTPALYAALKAAATFTRPLNPAESPNRNFGEFDGMPVTLVPQNRFYSAITLNDGTTSGQTAGGYTKAEGASNINFMIALPSALMQITKHAVPRIFDPLTNQGANAWKFDYRVYHDAFVLANKKAGVYLHKAPAA